MQKISNGKYHFRAVGTEVADLWWWRLCTNISAYTSVYHFSPPTCIYVHRQHLCSAASHQATVQPHRQVTYGGRAFADTGPSTGNSLPKRLCDPSNSASVFGRFLKTFFLSEYWCIQHIRGVGKDALYKLTFYIILHHILTVWQPCMQHYITILLHAEWRNMSLLKIWQPTAGLAQGQ